MKKIIVILMLLIVSGCVDVETTTFSIEDRLPKKIEKIIGEQPLQLFFNGKDIYYIVYATDKKLSVYQRCGK